MILHLTSQSLQEAKLLLKESDELIREVYVNTGLKRKNCPRSVSYPISKTRKQRWFKHRPYVAFRRRTEKMQAKQESIKETWGEFL